MARNHSTPPPVMPLIGIVTVCGIIAAALVTAKGLTTGSSLILFSLLGFLFAVFMINHVAWWLVLVVGLCHTWLYIPGFPSALALFYVMALGLIPVLWAMGILKRHDDAPPASLTLKRCLLAYLAVLIVTMKMRGFGLRALGGEMWGSSDYLYLIIMIGLFVFHDRISLTERQWSWAITLYCLGGLVPSFAEFVFLLSQGRVQWIYAFVQPERASAIGNLAIVQGFHSGVLRFSVSKYVLFIFLLCVAFLPYRGRNRIWIAFWFLIAMIFAGLSGHRTAMVYLLLLVPTLIYFTSRKIPFRLLGSYVIGMLALILVVHVIGRSLPLAFQRALSWLPWADVSLEAKHSAVSTTMWRLDVWKRLWELVPEHLLIGRGLAFDSRPLLSLSRFTPNYNIEWAILSHNYHSGPLSMLIDLGIFGLLSGSAFLIAGSVRHYRLLEVAWHSERMKRFHRVLLASFCVDVVRFYFVNGDAADSIVVFILQMIVLEGLYRTNRIQIMRAAEVAE